MRIFFFHYNKPKSLQSGKSQITIHYKGVCHLVDNLEINVPTWGHLQKQQPKFVVKGKCNEIEFINNKAIIK